MFKRASKKGTEGTSESSTSTTATPPLTGKPFGLRVLYEPAQEANVVNLVLVHGLGGSAIETWTELGSKTFWPKLLHEDKRCPNLRIATFGYNAEYKNIFAPKNALGIQGFAKQLLDALNIDYEEHGNVSNLRKSPS